MANAKQTTVGANEIPSVILNDPITNANVASVLPVAAATSLAGKYALCVQANPSLKNPVTGNYDPGAAAPGTIGVPSVNTEGTKATFSSGTIDFTPVATPTDIFALIGSATKTVRLLKLVVTGFATAAISSQLLLIKRSTANSGSTPSDPAIVPHDSNDAAASAVFRTYTTTNPTLGSTVGNVGTEYLNQGATGAAGRVVWDFTKENDKGLVLRGVAELLCVNWAGAAVPAGTKLSVYCKWTEEG